MNWKKPFLASILSLVLLTVLNLGCKTETPTAPQPTGPQLTDTPQKPAHVGDNTCRNCHANSYDTVSHTKHYDTFKPLTDFPLDKPLTPITIFDAKNTEKPTSTTLDFSNAKVYGVMMNDYVIAEIPGEAGFKDKIYRVAAVKKTGDKWAVEPAKQKDIDNDGKPDWTAESFTCGSCHAPGIENDSPNYGVSCESCHGPGGAHVAATDKKGTMNSEIAKTSCMNCHNSDPTKDAKTGDFVVNNHQGTRNYFASKHAQSSQLNDCLACHTPHKANTSGATLAGDKPTDVCVKCHTGKTFDLEKLMWKNPSDSYNHFTKDHSFGAIKYEDLQDDPSTKPVEIKNPTIIELIKKQFPELAK